jgi:RimJ/RimL family protein N-acetyltransferase
LRAFESADVAELQSLLNAPELAGRRYLPDEFSDLAPLAQRQVGTLIDQWQKETKAWNLAVVDADSLRLVGHVRADWRWDPHCPSAHVVIAPDAQRRGFGTAALSLALGYLFEETPAHVVSAWVASWNHPGLAFAARCGYARAGQRPRAGMHDGVFFGEVAFDLLRREWQAKEATHRAP